MIATEFEYANNGENIEEATPGLRTFMGNMLVQTPFAVAGFQPYATAGIGYYRMERLTPGPYLVAAVDVEPHRLTDDAELMERARAGAVPVAIREGEQTRLNVRLVRLRPFVQGP